MFHSLDDNSPEDSHRYLISIQTALRPLSGTSRSPLCVLVGEDGDSGVREIKAFGALKVVIDLNDCLYDSHENYYCGIPRLTEKKTEAL